jgi:hypothetical protein
MFVSSRVFPNAAWRISERAPVYPSTDLFGAGVSVARSRPLDPGFLRDERIVG